MFCGKCGAKLENGSKFCGTCGALQESTTQTNRLLSNNQVDGSNSNLCATTSTDAQMSRFDAFMSGVKKGGVHYVLLAGAGLVILSVFLPYMNVLGMAEFKMIDTIAVTARWIVAFGMACAYLSMIGEYRYPVIFGHGYLFAFLVCAFQYHQKMKEMATLGRAFAKNAFNVGSGAYALAFGIAGLILGGLIATIEKEGEKPSTDSLIVRWKEIMLQPFKLYGVHIPGIAWSTIFAVILLFLASEVDEF